MDVRDRPGEGGQRSSLTERRSREEEQLGHQDHRGGASMGSRSKWAAAWSG